MRKSNTAALLLIAMISGGAYALDLTPHEIMVGDDGPPAKRYFFENGRTRLSFKIDNKMTINGASGAVAFRFDDIHGASMTLAQSALSPGLPFDEKNLAAYRASARTFLPPAATNIQLEDEKPEAIAINGWTSRQFVFTYHLFGVPSRRAVTFLNFSAQEQIIFDISATAADFEKTYARGFRVLNSMADLPVISKTGPT